MESNKYITTNRKPMSNQDIVKYFEKQREKAQEKPKEEKKK